MKALVRKYVFDDSNTSSEYVMVGVEVGDWVGFKSDTEQSGRIVEIHPSRGWDRRDFELVLENENGFPGDYLRYATRCTQMASDCWVD